MEELFLATGDLACRTLADTSAYVDLGCGHSQGERNVGMLVLLAALAILASVYYNSRKSKESQRPGARPLSRRSARTAIESLRSDKAR